jgi:hypothetical protein
MKEKELMIDYENSFEMIHRSLVAKLETILQNETPSVFSTGFHSYVLFTAKDNE